MVAHEADDRRVLRADLLQQRQDGSRVRGGDYSAQRRAELPVWCCVRQGRDCESCDEEAARHDARTREQYAQAALPAKVVRVGEKAVAENERGEEEVEHELRGDGCPHPGAVAER